METTLFPSGALEVLLGRVDERLCLGIKALIGGDTNQVIDAVSFAPAQHLPAAKARIGAQQDTDLGPRLAAAMHKGEQALAGRLAQGRYTTLENTAEEVPPERLHPGAARYYREARQLRE